MKASCTPQHILSYNDTLYIHLHRSSKMKWQNLLEFQDALVYDKNRLKKVSKSGMQNHECFFSPTAQLNGTAGILNTSYPTQMVNHVFFYHRPCSWTCPWGQAVTAVNLWYVLDVPSGLVVLWRVWWQCRCVVWGFRLRIPLPKVVGVGCNFFLGCISIICDSKLTGGIPSLKLTEKSPKMDSWNTVVFFRDKRPILRCKLAVSFREFFLFNRWTWNNTWRWWCYTEGGFFWASLLGVVLCILHAGRFQFWDQRLPVLKGPSKACWWPCCWIHSG